MYKPLIVFFLLNFSLSWSQKDFVTSGGDGKSDQGSFSYSIGQILAFEMKSSRDTWSKEALSLNHGVQQVFIATVSYTHLTLPTTPYV